MIEVLHRRVEELGARPAFRVRRRSSWEPISFRGYGDLVRRFAKGLLALDLPRGGAVGILGENRPEWAVADLGAMAAGLVPAGLPSGGTPELWEEILASSGAVAVVVEGADAWARLAPRLPRLPSLRHAIRMDPAPQVLDFDGVLARGDSVPDHRYRDSVAALRPGGLATLVYTSGTTGRPRGARLSHHNLVTTSARLTEGLGTAAEERLLSYLPLSHVAEQLVTIHLALWNGIEVCFSGIERLRDDLRATRPTLFFGVPRVWEKLRAGVLEAVEGRADDRTPRALARRQLFRRALAVGGRAWRLRQEGLPLSPPLAVEGAVLDRLVSARIRAALGFDRLRAGFTAAAPIDFAVLDFFWSLGLPVLEIYGQSEGTGPVTVNAPAAYRVGTAGRPLPGIEVRIAPDGEVLVRGGNVFLGYQGDEAATAAVLDGDGWLHTGDVGSLDPDGFLRIADRKKELLVTSTGRKVAPAPLEAILNAIPPVGHAVVVGEGKPYLGALLALDPAQARTWAESRGIPFTGIDALAADRRLSDYLGAEIEAHLNSRVARHEAVRRFRIVPGEFAAGEEGELTSTRKLRRKAIARKWAAEIAALFPADEGTDRERTG
jgi:long-chain acyl-CoA synthetase